MCNTRHLPKIFRNHRKRMKRVLINAIIIKKMYMISSFRHCSIGTYFICEYLIVFFVITHKISFRYHKKYKIKNRPNTDDEVCPFGPCTDQLYVIIIIFIIDI